MVVLKNDDWKTVRGIISPVFSGGKLKNMMGVMNHCAKECMDQLSISAKNGGDCELKEYVFFYNSLVGGACSVKLTFSVAGRFTLDVVGQTMFGVQTDSTKTKENDFVDKAAAAFDDFTFASLPMLIISKSCITPPTMRPF